MAYTSVIAVDRLDRSIEYIANKDKTTRPEESAASLEEAVDYACNRNKTEGEAFESAIGCTLETAFEDMRSNKIRWNQLEGIQGYHLVQSFAEGELTPELAHQIGKEFAEKLLHGKHPAVVTTHLNTHCLHNHIVWDSVEMDTGRKYHSNARSYYEEVRTKSDELCRKYGLSVITAEEPARSMPYSEWAAERRGLPTWRTAIRQDVDEAIQLSLTWRQFVEALKCRGYELRFDRKYPTLKPPGKERPVRFKTLGVKYEPETIRLRILYPRGHPQAGRKYGEASHILHARLRDPFRLKRAKGFKGLRVLYYRYLYALGALPRKPYRPSYAVRQDIRKLDTYITQMRFLNVHGIDTRQQLTVYRQSLQVQITELTQERYSLYRTQPGSPRIGEITRRLKSLRQEDKMCRNIEQHSKDVEQHLAQAKSEKLEQQKEIDEKQKSKEKTI